MACSKEVDERTEELAKDFIRFKLGKDTEVPSNLTAKTLRRLATELELQHGELFSNMLKTVHSVQRQSNETIFLRIAKEMFTDQIVNWGRIAVLYTFAGQMALLCERNNMKTESEHVACWLSSFVKRNLSGWIVKNGGWDSFNEYFKEKRADKEMWWGNVVIGLVAGAAGAALVFAR